MKATGIVKRVDELGRIVIPKEIRRIMRIKENDELEIVSLEDGFFIKKYSALGEINKLAKEYVLAINKVTKNIAIITDRDCIIATSHPKQFEIGDKLSLLACKMIKERSMRLFNATDKIDLFDYSTDEFKNIALVPIISTSNIEGAILIFSSSYFDNAMLNILSIGATFFASQF
ncbi:MAG: AbrB/MazE/SpoVT family DNA-binding domain-containing protein [Christensenellaceae bacterium]|jgi:AbrB family transcriptional regulator (stage V sporulation protein T)|nr:AbrB/MazE/SpoVT family DNA-binding domain-containing protein [Christensenellaceae bacterium]